MEKTNSEEILEKGYVDVKVRVAGILQKHHLTVEYETTAFGKMPYLTTKVDITIAELSRVANELQLPIKAPAGTIFPQGKSPKDFTINETKGKAPDL